MTLFISHFSYSAKGGSRDFAVIRGNLFHQEGTERPSMNTVCAFCALELLLRGSVFGCSMMAYYDAFLQMQVIFNGKLQMAGRPRKKPDGNTFISRQLRKLIGEMTFSEFERINHLPVRTLQRIMDGNDPRISTLTMIAKACGVTLDYFFEGDTPQKKSPPARATGTGMCGALRDPLAPDAGSRILDFLSEKLPPEQRLMLEFIWYNLMRAEGKARLALAKTQDERGLIGFEVFENTAKCGQVIYALCTSLGFDPNVPYGTPVPPDKSDT